MKGFLLQDFDAATLPKWSSFPRISLPFKRRSVVFWTNLQHFLVLALLHMDFSIYVETNSRKLWTSGEATTGPV